MIRGIAAHSVPGPTALAGLRKPYLVVPGVALAVLLAIVLLADRVLIRNFERLEQEDVLAKIGQVERALDTELNQLAAFNRDYAEWDDALAYVRGESTDFADSNFHAETLDGLQTDIIWMVDDKGRDIYSTTAVGEGDTARLITPAPEGLLAALRPLRTRVEELRALDAHERLLRIDGRIAAISGMTVTDSARKQHSGAAMFFVRYLQDDEVERLRETSALPVELYEIGRSRVLETDPAIRAWLQDPENEQQMLQARSPDQMTGVALLRDIQGTPVAVLHTEVDRHIFFTGRRNTWFLVGAIATLLTTFAFGMLGLFLRLQRSVRAHEEEQQRYQRVIASLEESVALADADTGLIVECNSALLRCTGHAAKEIEGLPIEQIFLDYNRLCDSAHESASGAVAASGESRLRACDGRVIDADVTLTDLRHSGKRLLCLVARDITIRKQAERQREEHRLSLEHLAHHDALTGLPNRLYLKAQLPVLLKQLAGSTAQMGLLYIDLDQFKGINDTKGHAAGDELLRITAQRLRGCVSAHDTVIRMGGDEFVILARDLPGRQPAAAVARRIVEAVREPLHIDGTVFSVSASVGISVYPDDGFDLESLLKHADIALYEAKSAGRDNFKFFDAEMNIGRGERVALQQALRHAIGTPQIFVEYQPVIDLQTGQLSSFEALVRWNHPELGLVAPTRFVPVAEQSGLIHSLGEQIIDLVCRQLVAWRGQGLVVRPVAVNVSPLQLERESLVPMVQQIVANCGLELHLLQFEITETAIMQEAGKHMGSLQTLRDLGCKISIDDFGTGYSSLSQLKNLPLDRIKIDRSFVRDMSLDSNDAAIVSAVISMARSLGLEVVAEGIESAEQLGMLQGLGCEFGQGYHFGRSMAAEHCVALLEQAARSGRLSQSLKVRQLRSLPDSMTG